MNRDDCLMFMYIVAMRSLVVKTAELFSRSGATEVIFRKFILLFYERMCAGEFLD